MATFNWPGFGIASISWSFDQPSQSNASQWTGTTTIVSNPWHGARTAKVQLATQQGDGAFRIARAFFTGLLGRINTFHLPAVETPQNSNTGVTLSASASAGATSVALTGLTDALVVGNMITIAGQLLQLTSVGSLSGSAQTVTFSPTLWAAAASGAAAETAKPYLLCRLSDSTITWDIGQWRRYGLTFNVEEAINETDGASPSGDTWNATFSSSGGASSIVAQGVSVQEAGGPATIATLLNFIGGSVTPSGSTVTISLDAVATPEEFGAVGDGTTDDSAAFLAALAALKAAATTGYGYGSAGAAKLFIPRKAYYLATTTLDIDFGLIIEGESSGLLGPGASVLKWAAGTTGLRTQMNNTTGATGVLGSPGSDSGIATFRNLVLQGTYSGTESEAHGIHLRCTASIEDVGIYNFAGDGVHILATAGGGAGSEGNANSWFAKRVFVQGCRNGFFVDGADVNGGVAVLCAGTSNRQWAFWDSGFLGNTYVGCQAQENGLIPGSLPCIVSDGTYRYCVIAGQETGASTHAPTSGVDNAYWYCLGAGTVNSGLNIAAWTSGTTYRAGGSFHTDDSNARTVLSGCYHEGGQGFAQLVGPTLVIGGMLADGNVKGVACLSANQGLGSTGNWTVAGVVKALGIQHDFGPQSGTGDLLFGFHSMGSTVTIPFTINGVAKGSITAGNFGLFVDHPAGVWLRYGGANIAATTSGGLDLQTGMVLSINGTRLVTARQTGTAANASDLATAITLVNDLKTKLVAHGLIS